jgi:two-component system response regulator NreC
MSISILLADDHRVVRQGLRTLLQMEADFQVVGEASDGLETLEQVRQLKPNVAVIDLMMPGIGGLQVTRQIKRNFPQTHSVILSMHANEAYVVEALRSGASAYVLKDATAEELVRAIREAAQGRRYLSPPLSENAIETYMQRASDSSSLDLYETLTTRERQILHLAAEGNTSSEIAQRLLISSRTAETHRANMMRKLGLHSQTDVVQYALKRGIIQMKS